MSLFSKENFIFIYNKESADSEEVASYYALKRGMSSNQSNPSTGTNSGVTSNGIEWEVNGQLVGINCGNDEILQSEADFIIKVIEPIQDAMSYSTDLQERLVCGIIVGYLVPGGFLDGDDIVSTQSRLSRIGHIFSKRQNNKLYNRSVFSRYDTSDSSNVLICSRIDGPDIIFCKNIIDNGIESSSRLFADGTFYIDPYSDKHIYYASEYENEILKFYNNGLNNLNLDVWSTSRIDPYIDSNIPYVLNDSFVWSWFSPRGSASFFQYSNAIRVFFYNADNDGAYSIRDSEDRRWVFLSLNANYSSTAGAMSNPGIDAFLNPSAFFNALLRGATVGEAFLFSCPYIDWTIGLFGDPLISCSFPNSEVEDEEIINHHIAWEMMSENLAISVANLCKKKSEYREILVSIVEFQSEAYFLETSMLYVANNLYNTVNDDVIRSQYSDIITELFSFPKKIYFYKSDSGKSIAPSINTYLQEQNFKVSGLLADLYADGEIDEDYIYPEGWWKFEFEVQDDTSSFSFYHFKIYVYENEEDIGNVSSAIIARDSIELDNWTYETSNNVFEQIFYNGVSSSYIGRRVKYECQYDVLLGINEYLERGKTYYINIVQYDAVNGTEYSNRNYSQIIWT